MNILRQLTSRMPRPRLLKVRAYRYGRKLSRNLAPLSQGALMLAIIVYSVSLFLAPTQAARGTIEHYSSVAVAAQTQTGTSDNWANVTGTSNSGTTASTNGWIDSANLTATEDYLVMVWAEHSTSSTLGRSGVRVAHGGTAFTQSQAIEETDQTNAAIKTPYFWFTVWTAVADEDLEVQFYNATNTHTAAVEDVTMVVMNAEDLVANNELIYNISTTGGTLDTTFTPKASITWTPDNANDTWWLGGYVQHDTVDIDTDQHEARFDINSGTIRSSYSIEGEDAADTPLYGLGWVQQFAASSQTVELEVRESAANEEWDSAGLFALRLDGFETFKAYAQTGDGTALTVNDVYVEQGNVDQQMLSEGNFITAAGAIVDDNNGVVLSKLQLDGADITDPTGGYQHNTADTVPTTMADMQIDAPLGLKDIDFVAARTAAATAELQDRWVVAFSMERAGPPAELTIDGYIFENDDATVTGNTYGDDGVGSLNTITISGQTSGTDTGSSATTASVSVDEGDLVLVSVGHFNDSGGVNASSVSGLGITWSNETVTFGSGFERITYFWGVAPSTTSGTLSITFGGETQEDIGWSVAKATGHDETTPVPQAVNNTVFEQTSIDVTMAAAANANSVFITSSYFIDNAVAEEASYTELYSFDTTFGGAHLHTQYGDADITSSPGITGISGGTDESAGMVGLEIAAGTSGSGNPTGDDPGELSGGTQTAGSEFSSGQTPTGVRAGERLNLRVHLTNSGGTLTDLNELALFYDRGDGIWGKVKSQQPPSIASGGGCDDSAWTCETVVSANDVGRYGSMAIDRLGHPWVSYIDATNSNLSVARYVGSEGSGCSLASWSCQTIDGSNTVVPLPTGIAVGKESDVWIAYRAGAGNDLRVARFVGAGGNCDDLYSGSDAWECTTVVDQTSPTDAEDAAITIDRFGNPWISYANGDTDALEVAQYVGSGGTGCTSSAWSCTVVESSGISGALTSIAFDEDGRPWVSYTHSSNDEIKVARYVQGGGSGCASSAWTCQIIDSDTTNGRTSIAFSPNGTAYVSYYDSGGTNLRIASYEGSGGDCGTLYGGNAAWECTEIDSTNSVGSNVSMAFSPGGDAWISYSDATNSTLRLARWVGSGGSGCAVASWSCSVIESVANSIGGSSSLGFDANGLPWISHFDETADNLLVAYMNSRAGEVITSRSQGLLNGTEILTSRSDMTSVSDTSNRDSADCVATATWNDGRYFENETGTGLSLTNGLGADQCTEVMWTLDTSQATPGTTYRFIVATADNFRPDHGQWRGPIAVNEFPSLTMATAEESVYRYSNDNLLQFSNCNTDTAWGCTSIDATDGGGQYTSTGFDHAGAPWASYYETTGDDLKVARYVGSDGSGCSSSAWHCTTIDSGGDVGLYTSLAFDHSGAAWISYYDATNDDLKVTRYVGTGGTGCDSLAWTCTTVDSAGDTGQYSSLAFDASGKAWVSYYDVTNADLDIARYVGTAGVGCNNIAWTCTTIESADDIGSHSSLAFDAKGKPWVSYYDATNGDLKTANYTGLGNTDTCSLSGGAATVVVTGLTSGTNTGSSVNTASVAVDADDLVLVSVGNFNDAGSVAAASVSGLGITWSNETVAFGSSSVRASYFWGIAPSTTSGALTISFSGQSQEDIGWTVAKTTGHDGTTPVPQAESNSVLEQTSIDVTMAAAANANSIFITGAYFIDNAVAEESGYTEEYSFDTTFGAHMHAQYGDADLTSSPGVTGISGGTDESAGIVGLEIAAGSSAGGNSNWNCETVDATDDVGMYSSLAFDANGDAWISYYDNTGGNLEVANFTGGGGDCDFVGGGSDDWECTTVDSTDNVGRFTSIAFDASGAAWVSYLDFTNTDLNAARYIGGSSGDCNSTAWDCMDISSSAGGNNAYTGIAFDASGTPWISHESTSSNSLNFARMHLPPTKPTSDILIPFATRSALTGDARYRLHSGLSPYTDPYGTCGASANRHGYCGLFHPEGERDGLTAATNERAIYSMSTRFSSNGELPTAHVVFMSSVSPATENVVLQIYRFGTTNAWETVSTYSSAGCTTDTCSIRAHPSGTISEYFETDGGEYWVHFRVYQTESDSGSITLQLDHFTAEVPVKFLRGGRVFRETQTDPLGW